MLNVEDIAKSKINEENFGFLLWQLEEFEHFYPTYKTLIKKE